MHDVELIMCTRPVHRELVKLREQVLAWEQPRARRESLLPELRALVANELGAGPRWTPYYDAGLQHYASASDDELLEPGYSYDPDPTPYDRLTPAHRCFEQHAQLVASLEEAQRRGAWTLAAAFERASIPKRELTLWFGLCPDPRALDRRLRAAARAYLDETSAESSDRALEEALLATGDQLLRMQWFASQPTVERHCAVGLALTSASATTYDLTEVPDRLLQHLGNPFDPTI